jgi:hypothetical protein
VSDTKRRIEDILSDWLLDCGEEKTSSAGATYYKIKYKGLTQSFEVLLNKLIENGYTEEYIKSVDLNTKIAKTIWPDYIRNIPKSKLNENRRLYMSFWYMSPGQFDTIKPTVVGKRFRGKIDKPAPAKEVTVDKKIDKIIDPDWNPKDRKKFDTSDIVDAEYDVEFLNELREINGEIHE